MISISDLYEKLSAERKFKQSSGEIPEFFETPGYSMFIKKYAEPGKSVKDRYESIAREAAKYAKKLYGDQLDWEYEFFNILWKGWLSPSTPLLSNFGTNRGLPIACEGSYIGDSVWDFYETLKECAVLTQQGFGTSAYMGDIRPRGSKFSDNGQANGVVPVFENFAEMTNQISQGSNRRGSFAGYIEADHPDFDEFIDSVFREPANKNVGFIFTQDLIDRMIKGEDGAKKIWGKVLRLRATFGKGYIWKVDTVNEAQPEAYKKNGLKNKASNLCSEITLFSDEDHSYTCVLSSLNLSKYDEWRDTNLVFLATVFLDCVVEGFIEKAENMPGLERAVRYTKKARSLGLGVMGYHDLLQQKSLDFETHEAAVFNKELFKNIEKEAKNASMWMAMQAGEPEWCEGTGYRNTHLMAVAPTMSTALIVGGTSQGIEPFIANAWTQNSAAGDSLRVNPNLIKKMKAAGVYKQETIDDILDNSGSVQHVTWLSDEDKQVFKTAFELDQMSIIKQASDRQQHIDQGQSLNLFFTPQDSPAYINSVHKAALLDPYIKGLYYLRSQHGQKAKKGD